LTTMKPQLRKFALTAHIASSVGWLGAVAAFLTMAIAGLTSGDAQMVRSVYLAMQLTGWFVIVPFNLASLLTGLVMSLGTKWGLFRHYWVLAKFLINILATVLLLLHMKLVNHMAGVAVEKTLSNADLHGLRIQLVADAAAALLVLLVATTLAVYKPRGMTPYGRRKQHEPHPGPQSPHLDSSDTTGALTIGQNTPRWVYVFGITLTALVLLFRLVLVHLTGDGLAGLHH
jgi:hypothetical protein